MIELKKWKDRLEQISTAAAFAEADDHDTARRIMPFEKPFGVKGWLSRLSDVFSAAAFAEAGDVETAGAIMGHAPVRERDRNFDSFLRAAGLEGARFAYGVAHV